MVVNFWPPAEAAKAFPHVVRGGKGPPYVDGVVEAKFDDLDPNGKPYPNEVAAGTSAHKL